MSTGTRYLLTLIAWYKFLCYLLVCLWVINVIWVWSFQPFWDGWTDLVKIYSEPHMTPSKISEWSKFKQIYLHQIQIFIKYLKKISSTIFCFCSTLYTKKMFINGIKDFWIVVIFLMEWKATFEQKSKIFYYFLILINFLPHPSNPPKGYVLYVNILGVPITMGNEWHIRDCLF